MEAELVVGLCERFHCLPSEVMREDARFIGMLKLYDMVHGQKNIEGMGEEV